jgi:hypothetical protein
MYQNNINDAPISLLRRIARILSFIQKLAVSNFYMNIVPLSSVNQLIFFNLQNTVPLQKYFSGTGVVRSEKSQFLTLKLNTV